MSLETIQSLINAGAEPQKAFFTLNNEKLSALNFSVSVLENQNLTELLLKHGAVKSFDVNKVLSYLAQQKDAKSVSKLIELGVNPTLCPNQDQLFDLFLGKNDIPNLKKMIDGGYDINKKSLKDYTSVSFFENENLADKLRKFNTLIEIGYDVNRTRVDGNHILDDILNQFSDININNISINAFEKIIKNSSALKDKGYAKNCLKKMLNRENLRTESLDVFLENCPGLDMNILRSSLVDIFKFDSSIPESTIISLIKHIDDLNGKIKDTTMIGYALAYDDVSLDIIKAISEKMYFPNTPTVFNYGEKKQPTQIAQELGRTDIAEYIAGNLHHVYVDKKGILRFFNMYIGMPKDECIKIERAINEYWINVSFWGTTVRHRFVEIREFEFDKNNKLVKLSFKSKDVVLPSELQNKIIKEPYIEFRCLGRDYTGSEYKHINILKLDNCVIGFGDDRYDIAESEQSLLKLRFSLDESLITSRCFVLKNPKYAEYNKDSINHLKKLYIPDEVQKVKGKRISCEEIINNIDNVEKLFEIFE